MDAATQSVSTSLHESLRVAGMSMDDVISYFVDGDFLYAREAKEAGSPEQAKQILAEKEQEYNKLFCNPYNAAKYGYIDDVIEPRNTRFRVIRALQQLATKKVTNPAKKHGNIPL